MSASVDGQPLLSTRTRVVSSVASVLIALIACFLGIVWLKGSFGAAVDAYAEMLWGGIGDFPRFFSGGAFSSLSRPWGEWLTRSSTLLLTGLAIAAAYAAGLFNIGAKGQLVWGAFAAAVIGSRLQLPPLLHVPACLVGAAVAGALWALPAAILKLWRGVHEVITTIMLNWVAMALVENWLVVGPFRAAAAAGLSRSGTDEVAASAVLPRLLGEGSRLHAGVPIALLATFAVWLWLYRTRSGFETRAVGAGAAAAHASGVSTTARTLQAMAVSGALSGLAGALVVLGTELKYPPTLPAPYGFDGIALALIGQNHPFGVLAAAATFGLMRAGAPRMQLVGVHRSLPELIQGLSLILVAAPLAWAWVSSFRRKRPDAPAAPLTAETPRA